MRVETSAMTPRAARERSSSNGSKEAHRRKIDIDQTELRKADYARNLLATKDRATAVEVLTRSTGASAEEVERFVGTLERG
jgi:hypothetical protein